MRTKLSYFLNTDIEHSVIDKINEVYDIHPFKLQLWYDEGDITSKDLKGFLERYEKILHYKTTIKVGNYTERGDFTWFNMTHVKDITPELNYRFQYYFTGTSEVEGILDGLSEFKDTIEFVSNPKPSKQQQVKRKQKRNDYED